MTDEDRLYLQLAFEKQRTERLEEALKEALRVLRWHGLERYLVQKRMQL
jgi:hypothetical protein